MYLRGIKSTAFLMLAGAVLTGCLAPVPGGETGPFAPGNEVTFFYQSQLTDPPDSARIMSCENQVFARSCIRMSNGATFPLEATENGVSYGNDTVRILLQLDPTGVPSGVGQYSNLQTGETRGMRWVSLPAG